ncbi:MFS transporter [Arboricoccus pini]|uniref:MFS transporter n=1 Tax=Arboricoccus pini TaxID=1963835 RepID=UPI001FAE78E4|nr:MFS transporter [Arboricoccus pini]
MQSVPPSIGSTVAGPANKGLIAWIVYDWAISPFYSVIVTFVFASYFTQAVAPDDVTGTAVWGWATTAAAVIIAILSPIFGAIADVSGRRKPWLGVFTVICALAAASLWWIKADPAFVVPALLLVMTGNIAGEIGQSFYNAMLPDLAPRNRIGRWSGWGWGMGYLSGIVVLLLILWLFILADPPALGLSKASHENIRIAGPIVCLWLLLFSLPLFLHTPDTPSRGISFADATRQGCHGLTRSLREIWQEKNIVLFLISRLIYNDGLNTLFAFGGIYAAGTFGMKTSEIILFGVALNLAAGIGAFGFAWIDDRIGSKRTILIAVAGLSAAGIAALLVTEKNLFWATALALGIFIGPAQSASRTLMARLSPPEKMTEMFGIYALTGKVTAFIGPFLFGTATWLFSTQRAGMATILVMFLIGGLMLTRVREPPRDIKPRP